MSKTTIHFASQAECDRYFADYLPIYPSKYLIIIDSVNADSSGEVKLSNVLLTTSNNYSSGGATVSMGTSAVETAQTQTQDNDQALTLSEYTLEGEPTNISES